MDRTRERRFPAVMRALTGTDAATVPAGRRAVVWLWTVVSVGTVVLVAVGWPVTASGYGTGPAAAMVGTLLHCAAVALAVRWPWAGLSASVAGALVLILITAGAAPGWPWPWPVTVLLTHCLTVFVLALRHPWYWAASLWSAGALLTVLAPAAIDHHADDVVVANGVVLLSVSGAFALVGLLVRLWIASADRAEAAQRLSASEVARRRELEERNRIARELHDVVAHSMSVITVQATTARYRRPGIDEAVQQEFAEIAASSRRALGEMRGLLGILRGHDTAPTAPLPGLPDVADLVEATRASGVEIAYEGTDAEVPDAVGLTAFRVVQEALSNALRHAPGSSVAVTLSEDGHDLTVRIINSAPERSAEPAPGARLGLAGIRERVGAVRGTVRAGATADGGFELTAVIPVVEDADPLLT
ncbi:sensor histidine kinase [Myceligenerans indicum]|uniref:histidine kinase n=1 Tax=Myceligenerans indicum TaxID=2593663 RepID=A0ABS1LLY1_9MICO|nr:histidine kinase [Myceligenerans indicum]MBL0887034.1 histidine kinase [Myceligenerans indicum]